MISSAPSSFSGWDGGDAGESASPVEAPEEEASESSKSESSPEDVESSEESIEQSNPEVEPEEGTPAAGGRKRAGHSDRRTDPRSSEGAAGSQEEGTPRLDFPFFFFRKGNRSRVSRANASRSDGNLPGASGYTRDQGKRRVTSQLHHFPENK